MLKKLTAYKELNVLLNAVLVEAMAQIYCNQINGLQKASILFSSKNHLFISLNAYVWLFKDEIFLGFFYSGTMRVCCDSAAKGFFSFICVTASQLTPKSAGLLFFNWSYFSGTDNI